MKALSPSPCVFFVCAALLAPLLSQAARETVDRPNFLVILLDDAGWRDLGYAGNDFIETPNLDRLAGEGIVFTNAYATHPFCAPSRQSMLSGQWPARTAWMQESELDDPDRRFYAPPFSPAGAPAWTHRRPEFVSIAEALKEAGYATAHIGKWHFGIHGSGIQPETEGFDVNFGGSNSVGAVKSFFAPYPGLPGDVDAPEGEYLTDRLTDEAIDFMEAHRDEPWFVQLWHYAPHTPIQAPEPVVEKYRAKRRALGDPDLNPTYAAMMDVVDQGVGRILETLEELDLADDTVILFSSDNGGVESLGSVPVTSMEPLRGYKKLTYEGGVREPMFLHWPGSEASGTVEDGLASIMDFYPTMLDLAGVPLPQGQPSDGISLAPLLRGESMPELEERPLFWYNVTSGAEPSGLIFQPVAAVRHGDWRLVRNFGRPLELYYLPDDPGESNNLAEAEPERTARMATLLQNWLEDTGIALPTPNPNYDPDYVIPRQVDALPDGAEEVRNWKPGRDRSWRALRMVEVEPVDGALRLHSRGNYPEIATKEVAGLPAGRYALQVDLRVPTSGRVRAAWIAGRDRGNLEFFPVRDGETHTLTAVFEALEPLEQLRFAAPTHLEKTGHYDPEVHTDWIDVEGLRLYRLPGTSPPGKLVPDNTKPDPAMIKHTASLASAALLSAVPAGAGDVLFEDPFDRPDTMFSDRPSESVGPGYSFFRLEGDRFLEAGIVDGAVALNQTGPGEPNINVGLIHETPLPEEGFFVQASIRTFDKAAPSILYGLAFHVQEDRSFYAVRLNTGKASNALQVVRALPNGEVLEVARFDAREPLRPGTDYALSLASDRPGYFEIALEGPGIEGGRIEGTVTPEQSSTPRGRKAPLLDGGRAGLYATSPKREIRFNEFRIGGF